MITEGHADQFFSLDITATLIIVSQANIAEENTGGADRDTNICMYQIKQMT